MVIWQVLQQALGQRDSTRSTIRTIECCSNEGSLFKCASHATRDWVRISSEQRKRLTVRSEHTLGSVRFDVALVADVDAESTTSAAMSSSSDTGRKTTIRELDKLLESFDVDDALMRSLYLFAVSAATSAEPPEPLVLTGLSAPRRRDVHAFCDVLGLQHKTIGSTSTKTMFINAPSAPRPPSTPKVAPTPATIVAAFEVLHTSAMTRDKVHSLSASKIPFIEVMSETNGVPFNWSSVDEPLPCVRSSLPRYVCDECAADPSQKAFTFTHVRVCRRVSPVTHVTQVYALADVFAASRAYGRRHLFAQLERRGLHSLVEYVVPLVPVRSAHTSRQAQHAHVTGACKVTHAHTRARRACVY
jgi:hypothetical protein